MLRRWTWLITFLFTLFTGTAVAEGEEGAVKPSGEVEYVDLKPDVVTNFGSGRRMRFLRAKVAVRTSSLASVGALNYHMPFVRDRLIVFLSSLTEEQVNDLKEREKVRAAALESINKYFEAEGEPKIDDLLFTEFLVQ